MGDTPSLSSSARSFRSIALTPSNQGSAATVSGRFSIARSKSSARARTLRIRSSAASPRSRWRSSAVRRLKLRNSARSRWSAARYSSDCVVAAWSSAWRASISASSLVGEMSMSSVRSSARVRRSGIEVVHQFVHQARHEANRADGLGVAHPGGPEHADHADRTTRPPVRRQDERDVVHLVRSVLPTDVDHDPAGPGDASDEVAEIGPVLEGGEDAPELVALGELGRLHHVEQAVREDLLDRGRVVVADDPDDALAHAACDPLQGVAVPESEQRLLGLLPGPLAEELVEA